MRKSKPTANSYHSRRYRQDESFRLRAIARAQKYQERMRHDPAWRRQQYLSKRIYALRERVAFHMEKAERYEQELILRLAERDAARSPEKAA